MADDVVFFLAPDDETAAATRLRGPGPEFESVSCRSMEPDMAIAEWDMYFEQPSPQAPTLKQLHAWRPWPEWVTPPLNDGIVTDEDLLSVLRDVTRLARSAVTTAGSLYSWSL